MAFRTQDLSVSFFFILVFCIFYFKIQINIYSLIIKKKNWNDFTAYLKRRQSNQKTVGCYKSSWEPKFLEPVRTIFLCWLYQMPKEIAPKQSRAQEVIQSAGRHTAVGLWVRAEEPPGDWEWCPRQRAKQESIQTNRKSHAPPPNPCISTETRLVGWRIYLSYLLTHSTQTPIPLLGTKQSWKKEGLVAQRLSMLMSV